MYAPCTLLYALFIVSFIAVHTLVPPTLTTDRHEREALRAYRIVGFVIATAVIMAGVARVFSEETFAEPLWLRGIIAGAYLLALLLSFYTTWGRRNLGLMMYVLAYVWAGWTIWLGWLNNLDPSFVNTINIIVLAMGLVLGLLRTNWWSVMAFLVFNAGAATLVLHSLEAPRTDPAIFAIGLIGAVVAVSITAFINTQMRKRQQQSEEQWRQLVEEHPDAILISHADSIVYANAVALALLDSAATPLLGRATQILLPQTDEQSPLREVDLPTASGKLRHFEVQHMAVTYRGHVAKQYVLRDVTKHKEMERLLREAKNAAEATTQAKSDFLAMMSHEIRTPLNGIIGPTSMLLSDHLDEHQREQVDLIRLSSESLLTVINDILDFSKIEAGRLDLESTSFSIAEVMEAAGKIMGQQALRKGLSLETLCSDAVPQRVLGDPLRLRQILLNLVSNAVKFTETGSVKISVDATATAAPDDSDTSWWRIHFRVADTGIGIAPEKLLTLFDAFTQAERATTRKYGGTGLGLNISKRLAEMMGGAIWAESTVGEGSVFHITITVPAVSVAEPKAKKPSLPKRPSSHAGVTPSSPHSPVSDAHALRLLLAEDNAVNQKVALKMLERLGYTAAVANNGKEAVISAQAEPFDVILMDMMMPEMDGLEATRRLLANPPPYGTPYIIALTANVMQEDRRRCKEAGMQDFLAKPIQYQALGKALERAKQYLQAPHAS